MPLATLPASRRAVVRPPARCWHNLPSTLAESHGGIGLPQAVKGAFGIDLGVSGGGKDLYTDTGNVTVDYTARMHSRIPEIREDALEAFDEKFGHAAEDHYDRLEANQWLARNMADRLREEIEFDTAATNKATETAMSKTAIQEDLVRRDLDDILGKDLSPGAARRFSREARHYDSSPE